MLFCSDRQACVLASSVGSISVANTDHPSVYRHFGIDLAQAKLIVLKTASNFQYYTDVTAAIIRVDTPGPTMSHLEEFDWLHLPRPIWPLDERPDWR